MKQIFILVLCLVLMPVLITADDTGNATINDTTYITMSSGTGHLTILGSDETPLYISIRYNNVTPQQAVRLTTELTRVVYKIMSPCKFEINYDY